MRTRPARPATAVLAAVTAVLAAGCAAVASAGGPGPHTVNLVAYSTPQDAFDALVPKFTATAAGHRASVRESFGASGAQSRAVAAGQAADVVEFSFQPDMTALVRTGLVPADWNRNAYHGIVTDSVVVLMVRAGNPKGIHGWDDLARPGVKVVTPNPFSSGSAQWNLMAAYGSQVRSGASPARALAFVRKVLHNTVAQPESGSKATAAFTGGVGDVLIGYENEAIKARQAGQHVDFVTPDRTLLVENPVAVTSHPGDPRLARAFVRFLYTHTAQRVFAAHGYRPVVPGDLDRTRFRTPSGLFTIADLGGWPSVTTRFFDPSSGSITAIENSLGVSGG